MSAKYTDDFKEQNICTNDLDNRTVEPDHLLNTVNIVQSYEGGKYQKYKVLDMKKNTLIFERGEK